MTNFFTESMMTKQQRKHSAHFALVQVCADFIANGNYDERLEMQDYVDALVENMSIKLGNVERATIVNAYKEAIAKAMKAAKTTESAPK